jgi:CRISPR/Cas system-associated protein Cas7 (RAMP superfamily)
MTYKPRIFVAQDESGYYIELYVSKRLSRENLFLSDYRYHEREKAEETKSRLERCISDNNFAVNVCARTTLATQKFYIEISFREAFDGNIFRGGFLYDSKLFSAERAAERVRDSLCAVSA